VKLKLIVHVCSAECADGYFGHLCNNVCHCHDETEVCDKVTGHCESGCMAGRTDTDCQTGQNIALFTLLPRQSCGLLHMFIYFIYVHNYWLDTV